VGPAASISVMVIHQSTQPSALAHVAAAAACVPAAEAAPDAGVGAGAEDAGCAAVLDPGGDGMEGEEGTAQVRLDDQTRLWG